MSTADLHPSDAGPLSAALRAGTAAAHAEAERVPSLVALVEGRVPVAGVAALLGRLAPVHGALEDVGRGWADDPVVGPFLLPGLARGARVAADLDLLRAAPVASPAATAYAARVRAQGGTRAGYLAHHYTRSLADLSGGPVLGAAVQRSLGVDLSSWAFPGLHPAETARRYRALLDAAPLSRHERDALLAEALVAYRLNVALHRELDGQLSGVAAG